VVETFAPLLQRLCGSTEGQQELLRLLVARASAGGDATREQLHRVLFACYDVEVIDEDVLTAWSESLGADDQLVAASEPFFEWLDNAEEESD
jgi:hypothetical protein